MDISNNHNSEVIKIHSKVVSKNYILYIVRWYLYRSRAYLVLRWLEL